MHKITRHQDHERIAGQLTYTLHKPARYNFLRNKTNVMSIDDQRQDDLCDISFRAEGNDGFPFILMCIDYFSKYVWGEPLRNNSCKEILAEMKRFLKQNERQPNRMQG